MTKTYKIVTLGCKVNQQESETLAARFEAFGLTPAEKEDRADVCVINSCAVTSVADRKTRQRIRQARADNPDAFVCVIGCLPEIARDAVSSMPEVDLVIGSAAKERAAEIVVDALVQCGDTEPGSGRNAGIRKMDDTQRSRGFIKAQDGCDRYCAYCIIPYARGPVRSRSVNEVCAEAEALLAAGYRELVLTGINLALYGSDFIGEESKSDLYTLTERLCTFERYGEYRIRLGSLEPTVVDAAYAKAIAALPRACPHMHLSLQSGAARTLKAMGRPYSPGDYADIVFALRDLDPLFSVTTDVIVGFPGETDADFEESLAFVRQMGFAHIHVFKYSKRPGTKAAGMPDQVPEGVKSARARILSEAADQSAKHFLSLNARVTRRTLIYGPMKNQKYVRGLTDNGIDVRLPADASLRPNEFTNQYLFEFNLTE